MMVLLVREYMDKMGIKNRMPTRVLWEHLKKVKEVIV